MLCMTRQPIPPWLLIVSLICADIALAAITAWWAMNWGPFA
jgi:hypothetical protein